LNRSTTYVIPAAFGQMGVSICEMLRGTTFVGPARVTSVFICFGVGFCASSMIRNLLMNVRPRRS
jgi:hypothetical protein